MTTPSWGSGMQGPPPPAGPQPWNGGPAPMPGQPQQQYPQQQQYYPPQAPPPPPQQQPPPGPQQGPGPQGQQGPPGPPPPPVSPAAQAYIGAVAQRMMAQRMRLHERWVGPSWTLIGQPFPDMGAAFVAGDFVLGIAAIDEISPQAMQGFPRQLDEFARSQRQLGAMGGAMSVACLVSERVNPQALGNLKNFSQFGSGVCPAVVDLGMRQLHIASNTPIIGFAVFKSLRTKAASFLPDPRQVLG